MNKAIILVMILAGLLTMTACGQSSAPEPPAEPTMAPTVAPTVELTTSPAAEPTANPTEQPTAREEAETDSNILIAYFSRVGNMDFQEGVDAVTSASVNMLANGIAGNAELLAGMVQDATGGEVFFIEQEEKYPAGYDDTTDVAAQEQDDNARPGLISQVEDMTAYDTVILIYPNWWGDLPMGVQTFLEAYDFSGKTIYPLCTHEGSGLGRTPDTIAALCPNATVGEGLAVRGRSAASAQGEVETWLAGLGF